jgi:hypothetical protein
MNSQNEFTRLSNSRRIFALRGLYYAIMEEGQVPLAYTGSAVGLVSVTGYAPSYAPKPHSRSYGVVLDHRWKSVVER